MIGRHCVAALLLCGAPALALDGPVPPSPDGGVPPTAANPYDLPMSGEVTATTAIVQTRVPPGNGSTRGRFTLSTDPRLTHDRERSADTVLGPEVQVSDDRDRIVRTRFEGLTPNTRYYYRWDAGPEGGPDGRRGTFKTLPGPDSAADVRFVVAACINYAKFHGSGAIDLAIHKERNNTELAPPAPAAQRAVGYPGLEAIRDLAPDFVVLTGDTVYYDTPIEGRAKTLPEMRAKWHEQLGQPRFRDLLAAAPVFHMKDDHDFRQDDSDNSGDYAPTPAEGIAMFREQLPVVPPGPDMADPAQVPTYRTVRVNEHLQIWIVEGRDYRSPNALPDGPGKTIWGEEQYRWLTVGLKESDAAFKILISPTPLVGPDDARKSDNHTNFGGFRHERGRFFDFLQENGLLDGSNGQFVAVCGDLHWQYDATHPSGVREFSVGALDDTNSRPGRKAGEPDSTDPDGLIEQRYLMRERTITPDDGTVGYTERPPSGGFLLISTDGRDAPTAPDAPRDDRTGLRLNFTHFDEHGREQYDAWLWAHPPTDDE